MSITIADQTDRAARRRAALGASYRAADEWINSDPPPVIQFPQTIQLTAAGDTHEEKLAWLETVAKSWGVETIPDGMGGRRAEKLFPELRYVAVVCHPDPTVSGHKARAALALRTAITQNGATA